MSDRIIKVDPDLAQLKINSGGIALEEIKSYCGALYTFTDKPAAKAATSGGVESTTDVFGSMESDFIRAYEQYFAGLRGRFTRVMNTADTYYQNLFTAFNSIKELDETIAGQIASANL